MAKKVGDYEIPFDSEGNQLHFADVRNRWGPRVDWRQNDPFDDRLTFMSFSRGRSAAYMHFERANGKTVCMFLTDLADAIPHMAGGVIEGRFQFTKRGTNYGVRLLESK
jgi:hypothetical protein